MKNNEIIRTKLITSYKASSTSMIPFAIGGLSSIGIKFILAEGSRLVRFLTHCPSYSDSIGTLNISVYKWLGSFENTIKAEPVFTEDYVDFPDNSFLLSEMDKDVSDGEYLILCGKGIDTVGVWCAANVEDCDNQKAKYDIKLYTNGEEGGECMPRIILCIEEKDILHESVLESEYSADYVRCDWKLTGVPSYDYGVLAENLYNCGQGVYLKEEFSAADDSLMAIATSTNDAEYKAYIKKLAENGYKNEFHNKIDENIYDVSYNGKNRIYTYYTANDGSVRIILDKTSIDINDFGYAYKKNADDTTEVYQYGLIMAETFNPDINYLEYIGGGMSYFIKLADNGIYMIDGGMFTQYDKNHCDEFIRFMREITKTPAGEKVRIACWHITHGHDDHNSGFAYFMKNYHDDIVIERLMYNLPDEYNEHKALEGNCEYNHSAFESIRKYWPDAKELKNHTGERVKLADIEIEILFTHEDLVDLKSGMSIASEFNATSTISKIHFDGKTLMITGDATPEGEKIVVESFSKETVKSDMVQASHHMINPLITLYKISAPEILLIPQNTLHIEDYPAIKSLHDVIVKIFDRRYYAGNETVGLKVIDGKIVDFYHGKIVGGRYTDWKF